MEFNEYLTRIQGALVTLNRRNALQRDVTRPKEREMPSPLLTSLHKIICEFEGNNSELRKSFLYLLLNSNFSFVEEVANDDDFCHIVLSAPSIDKFLLVETMSKLGFNEFICEMIENSHIVICLEYLAVLLSLIHSDKSLLSIVSVERILSSVNMRLIDSERRRKELLNSRLLLAEKANCWLSYYFREFLSIYFAPPHEKNALGYVTKSLLSLLQACLQNRYSAASEAKDVHKIYSLSLSDHKIDSPTSDSFNFEKREEILCVMDTLEINLNTIDLSTWLSWSECEWQSPSVSNVCSKTVQEVIGLQAFLCRQEIEKFCNDLPEAVQLSEVLKNMEIKPVTDEDEIEKVEDITEIILKVNETSRSPESRKKWLLALLKFSWCFKEEECVDCFQQFGNQLDSTEDIFLLQKKVANILMALKDESPLDSAEKRGNEITEPLKNKMKNVVFSTYPQLEGEKVGNLVGQFFVEFGLTDCYLMEDFEGKVIKTFNKAVNASETKDQLVSDICVLCLQSPVEVIRRLLVLGLGCHSQITFVIEVLKCIPLVCLLKLNVNSFSNNSVCQSSDQEISLLCHQLSILMKERKWNETENSNLLNLVIQCIESSILVKEHFLEKCIIPGMEDCMENSCWNLIDIYLEMLNTVLTIPSSSLSKISNPAAILAYLLLILEKGRHHMRKNFSVSAASTCELIISQLPILIEKMVHQASFKENDLDWLRKNVLLASPLSQYYFSKLWPTDSSVIIRDFKSFILFLVFNEPGADEKRKLDLLSSDSSPLSHSLYMLLPSCTTSEWLNITSALMSIISEASEKLENMYWTFFHLISSILIVLIKMANRKYLPGEENVPYCIELWFKNYMRIVKDEFLPCCKYFNSTQVTDLFMMIIIILEEVPADKNIRETCSFLALNILSTVAEMHITQDSEGTDGKLQDMGQRPNVMKLISCISLMSEEETKKGLAKIILEILNK